MSHSGSQSTGPASQARSKRLAPWLSEGTCLFGERTALASSQSATEEISYAALESRTADLASCLHGAGLRHGDAIALWLPNRPMWMVVHLAAARLGLFTVPLNTWCREVEIRHFLALGRCKAIVMDSTFRQMDFHGVLQSSLQYLAARGDNPLRWVIDFSATAQSGVLPRGVASLSFDELQRRADGFITSGDEENRSMIAFPTSGTTSAPKLAVHRECALLAHTHAVALKSRMTSEDVVLGVLPPCGAYGYTLLLASLQAGARAVLLDEFDIDQAIGSIESERVSMLAITEPLVRRLLDHPRATASRLGSLRLVFSAGGTLEPLVWRAETEFGFRITNVYGSSEVLALAAFWDDDCDVHTRSMAGGRLVSHGMCVRTVDSAGHPTPSGTEGELQFRGPAMSCGYLSIDPAAHDAFRADGWFSSKDLGRVLETSAGKFVYMARLDDALRIAGFLVSPAEIEALLQTHPAVATAQVVGVARAYGEHLAAAFVVLKKGHQVDAHVLQEFCRKRMASYKTPDVIEIVHEFPMTRSANGDKVMKTRLRQMAEEILARRH